MISLDTETFLISAGVPAPPLVCTSVFDEATNTWELYDKDHSIEVFKRALEQGIVGTNLPFDFGVFAARDPKLLDLIFECLEAGKAFDVATAEALHANAHGTLYTDPRNGKPFGKRTETGEMTGRYSLAFLEDYYLGHDRSAEKDVDSWRYKYALLENVPLKDWPKDAVQYPLNDAKGTYEVYAIQKQRCDNLQCLKAEMQAAWFLKLSTMWGMRTDPVMVPKVVGDIKRTHVEREKKFQASGVIKPDGKGDTKVLRALVTKAYAGSPPKTGTGQVKINRATLAESGNTLLQEYAEAGINEKLYSTYVNVLEMGTQVPVNSEANAFVATQRTSYAKPNLQQLPRDGWIRHCFVPRAGWLYSSVDYAALELCSLSQICLKLFGYSKMADAINNGQDLHVRLAARFAGISYEEALARKKAKEPVLTNLRQSAKTTNFSLGGLAGPPKLTLAARNQGVKFCELAGISTDCSKNPKVSVYARRKIDPVCGECLKLAIKYKKMWHEEWPETGEYHSLVIRTVGDAELSRGNLKSLSQDGMLRQEYGAAAMCNHYFQNLAAVGAKHAGWLLAKESYTNRKSVLYNNFRTVVFIHDEVIAEIREPVAHECAVRQAEIMVNAMQEHIPDVKISAEPALMRRWFKGAQAVFGKDKKLKPWWPSDWSWGPDQEQMQKDNES